MNVKFINPFVVAVSEVLRSEAQAEVGKGEVKLHRSACTGNEVTTLLTLVGQVEGVVMYGMSISMALALVSKMLGQTVERMDDLVQSGIGELGNVITGRATTLLASEGYISQISVPTLIVGSDVQISTLDFQRLVVSLVTSYGKMEVHVALRERKATGGLSPEVAAAAGLQNLPVR